MYGPRSAVTSASFPVRRMAAPPSARASAAPKGASRERLRKRPAMIVVASEIAEGTADQPNLPVISSERGYQGIKMKSPEARARIAV